MKITRTARKAITGALATLAGTTGGLMADGNLTGGEVVAALGAALVAGAAVYAIPNATR